MSTWSSFGSGSSTGPSSRVAQRNPCPQTRGGITTQWQSLYLIIIIPVIRALGCVFYHIYLLYESSTLLISLCLLVRFFICIPHTTIPGIRVFSRAPGNYLLTSGISRAVPDQYLIHRTRKSHNTPIHHHAHTCQPL